MTLGSRIFSKTLSGKTYEVLFNPTSGGTINLGEKNGTFNNLTDYPYGNYEIYIPYYDFTYDLNIPLPSPTSTPTPTPTPSITPTQTVTPTNTITPTNTPTPSNTPTNTPTPSNTPTNTPTPSFTPTPTPTLTPVNSIQKQSVSIIAYRTGSTDYSFFTINAGTGNIVIVDTNLSGSIFQPRSEPNSGDFYRRFVSNESCYKHTLIATSISTHYSFFLDQDGNLLGSYSGLTTNNYKFFTGPVTQMIVDYSNGVVKYTKGSNLYTYTYDTNIYDGNSYVSYDWDWHDSDGGFIIVLNSNLNDTYTAVYLNGSNQTEIKTWGYNTEDVYFQTSFNCDFFAILSEESTYNDGYHQNYIKVYDTNLVEKQNFVLTGYNLTRSSYCFYGINKLSYQFYNSNHPEVDYLFLTYDGNLDSIITTTHNKSLYPVYDYFTASKPWNQSFSPYDYWGRGDCMFLYLYDTSGYTSWQNLRSLTYCDLLYLRSGDTTYQTYTVNNTGVDNVWVGFIGVGLNEKKYAFNGYSFVFATSNNAINYNLVTIGNSGTTTTNLGTTANTYNVYFNWFGETSSVTSYELNSTGATVYLLSNNGNLIDSHYFSLTPSDYVSIITNWNLALIQSPTESYFYSPYLNSMLQLTGITYGGSYSSDWTPPYYDIQIPRPNKFLYIKKTDEDGNRILREDGTFSNLIPTVSALSNPYNQTIFSHKTKIGILYNASDMSGWKIRFYDFDGNYVSEIDTMHADYYPPSFVFIKNRSVYYGDGGIIIDTDTNVYYYNIQGGSGGLIANDYTVYP